MAKSIGKKGKRVLVALSGGIDSAVSAYLLIKAGYEVEAAFMKNWSSKRGLKYDECPWLIDRQDALRVAAFLRIPLHTLDFEKEYTHKVLSYFFREYQAGRTPNPDVMCNKEIKFRLLYARAREKKFDFLATGHYAQIKQAHGGLALVRSADEFKDQTYFIYNIKQSQLPHLLFPVGHLRKNDVRTLAREIGLPNAEKKESMGLCFVGKIRLKEFLEQRLKPKPGLIKTLDGQVLGKHDGIFFYTVGQRHGMNIGTGGGPYFVVRKDKRTNTLFVTNDPQDPEMASREVVIQSLNWIRKPALPASVAARYRHQGELQPAKIYPLSRGKYRIAFRKPQNAVASGQSVVLYSGRECLGGGVVA